MVPWTDIESDALETGVVCLGTDWGRMLRKYQVLAGRTVQELREQYYVLLEHKGLFQANLKHAVVVTEYGKPVYRGETIEYFFCIEPLHVLREMVGVGCLVDGDVFVGTLFDGMCKMHRYAVSKDEVRPVSTADMRNLGVCHEWRRAVEMHLQQHPRNLDADSAVVERELRLSRD